MLINKPVNNKLPTSRRLSIELSDDLYQELDKIFDFGERKIFFTAVCEATINIYKRFGKEALYLMISGRTDMLNILTKNRTKQAE